MQSRIQIVQFFKVVNYREISNLVTLMSAHQHTLSIILPIYVSDLVTSSLSEVIICMHGGKLTSVGRRKPCKIEKIDFIQLLWCKVIIINSFARLSFHIH